MIQEFMIDPNEYLNQEIQGFYCCDYVGYNQPNNPDYINTLKNTFNYESKENLESALKTLISFLYDELYGLISAIAMDTLAITVCVVPRSKALQTYSHNQLLFRKAVSYVVDKLIQDDNLAELGISVENGTDFIIRHTNTRTTHLDKSGYGGDGELPYVGITKDTCTISPKVRGKHILLVDDIYTKTVNIDEDCIQALLDNGAEFVDFFAVAKTKKLRTFERLDKKDIDDMLAVL